MKEYDSLFNLCLAARKDKTEGVKEYVVKGETLSLNIHYFDILIFSAKDFYWENNTEDGPIEVLIGNKLIIPTDEVLTPLNRCKGLLLFFNEIENNGTISMSKRGASAEGRDVYLYKDEYVPKIGGIGGAAVPNTVSNIGRGRGKRGNTAPNAQGRSLAGGGSGASTHGDNLGTGSSGAGGTATSFSGGPGGGASGVTSGSAWAGAGSNTGGPGGYGKANPGGTSGYSRHACSGGAGNPAGVGMLKYGNKGNATFKPAEDGTGGLIIIYASSFINNGAVYSEGSAGGDVSGSYSASGGGSGGGSINIFYGISCIKGLVRANGGRGGTGSPYGSYGGAGGTGSITFMVIPELRCMYLVKVENEVLVD